MLAGSEFEQILAVGVHPQELHQIGFVAIPVQRVRDPRLIGLAVDDAVGHLLAPEQMAARQPGGRQIQRLHQLLGIDHLEQPQPADRCPLRQRGVFRRELGDRHIEAVFRAQRSRFGTADQPSFRKTIVQAEQQRPRLPFARQRDIDRFGQRIDVLRVQRISHGRPGVEAARGLVARVDHHHAARGVFRVFDGQHVGSARTQQLHPADAVREVRRLARRRRQHAGLTTQDRVDPSGALRRLGKAAVGRIGGANDFVDQRQPAVRRQIDQRAPQRLVAGHFQRRLPLGLAPLFLRFASQHRPVSFLAVLVHGDFAEVRAGRLARNAQVAGARVQTDFGPLHVGGAIVRRHLVPLARLAHADRDIALAVGVEQPDAGQVLLLAQVQVGAEREHIPVLGVQFPRGFRLAGRRPDDLPLFIDDPRRIAHLGLVGQHRWFQVNPQFLGRDA